MKRALIILSSLASLMAVASCGKLSNDGRLRFSVSTRETKASITETSDVQTVGQSFVLDAWLEAANRGDDYPNDNANPHYISKATVTLGASGWAGTNLTWRNGVWTNFWASYPKVATGRGDFTWPAATPDKITDDQEKTPSFTYDMTSYTASSAAAIATPDLLVGYARGKWNEDAKTGGVVKFDLQHVTSAISFTLSHVDSGCSIDDVTVAGVHYKGTCTLTGATESLKDTASVAWAFNDTPSTSVGFKCESSNFSADKYFFLIPQQLDSPAVLKASINNGGTSETKEVTLSGYSWKPGYKYTYKLSFYKDKDEFTVTTTVYNTTTGEWIN